MSLKHVILLVLKILICLSTPQTSLSQNDTVSPSSCPLNFTVLQDLTSSSGRSPSSIVAGSECQYILQGLRLVQSEYLRRTNSFLPPLNSAESCWQAYQTVITSYLPDFDIRTSCGFQTSWISQGCMNITTRAKFESLVPKSTLEDVVLNCNQSLENNSPCASCTTSLSTLQASYLTGTSVGNVSDCRAYPSVYAAAFANWFGPVDVGTAKCLFLLDFGDVSVGKGKKFVILVVSIVCGVGVLVILGGFLCLWGYRYGLSKRKRRKVLRLVEVRVAAGIESIAETTTLVKFTFDEIKKATRNFHRDNMIGKGGYGNVFKGVLPDGSMVAFKRFKNCSAAGDTSFAHEVEVVASVRHVNLNALRGYCIATAQLEGRQRIIVCDLMKNGSLHDHLFGDVGKKLSWPIRQNIALGTAKGLAYLHYGAQPGIIHRDIKASNILLDEKFEPQVADFGLAKFTLEGATHMSTRVAGTMGYVAPEYALYGQLTERSDVYSFGIVLLELLSGKKAIVSDDEGLPLLVADWAWSLVREDRALDVIEDGMPELGPPEVMEKYVLVAILCSHPQLYARPTMDQVVKMFETNVSIPSIPERPVSIVASMDDIKRSMRSSNSSYYTSSAGYQPYTLGTEHQKKHDDGRAPGKDP